MIGITTRLPDHDILAASARRIPVGFFISQEENVISIGGEIAAGAD
jgi:hypothetical protein